MFHILDIIFLDFLIFFGLHLRVGSYFMFEGFCRHYRQDIIHLYSQLKLRCSIHIGYKCLVEIAVCSTGNYM